MQNILERHKLPDRAVQNTLEIIAQLSNVRRYSRDFMVKEESVLEHIGFSALFCLIISARLLEQGVGIDVGRLIIRATLHDLEETITGDVSRKTKYCSPEVKEGIDAYGRLAISKIEELLDISIMYDWENAKDDSLEGLILKVADMAAVVYKTMTEVAMYGNKSFIRVSEEIMGEITKLDWALKGTCLHPVVTELHDILLQSRRGDITFGAFFRGL
jgi:putative hydrolase of HD superfamily